MISVADKGATEWVGAGEETSGYGNIAAKEVHKINSRFSFAPRSRSKQDLDSKGWLYVAAHEKYVWGESVGSFTQRS